MKKISVLATCCILACGVVCVSGCSGETVSQEEYDSLKSEKESLQADYDSISERKDFEIKLTEYMTRVDEQYENAQFVLYVVGQSGEANASEALDGIQALYYQVYGAMETVLSVVQSDVELEVSDYVNQVNSLYESWGNSYSLVTELEENLMSGTVDQNQETDSENPTVLFEDTNVRISFAGIEENGVAFWVENLTNANITIQADSVSVNGVSANDIVMSDDVAPQSKGKVVAKCDDFTSITNVETVGGQLRVIDFNNNLESYDATFVNVPIA